MRSSEKYSFYFAAFFLLVTVFATVGSAEVNVSIGVNVPLPVYVAPAPPPVVVIPNSYVYYVPNIDVDILFYHGYWYRPHGEFWYRSSSYNGPWRHMTHHSVPRALASLPPNYRHVPPGHQKIPYGHLKKNWSRWEKERHWHHNNWGHGRDHGRPDTHDGKGHGHKGFNDYDRGFDGRGHGR